MYCVESKSKVYGYNHATNQNENDNDIKELYSMVTKDSKSVRKLVVVGGLHGYNPTGEPTGQSNQEKNVCSFSMGDQKNKSAGQGIDFIYKNIARYTTDGSDVTDEKQDEIAKLIKDYADAGYYVLLAWCYSDTWARTRIH